MSSSRPENHAHVRRPGNRVVRRRVNASQTFTVAADPERPDVPNVRNHSKLFLTGLGVVLLVGTVLLALPISTRSGEATPAIDALVIAASAACVTGLVTVDTYEHWNILGQAVILVLMQVGGLGFMVGASVVLRVMQRGPTGLRETLLLRDGAPTLTIREAAELTRRIVRFTFAVEGIGALILSIRFAFDRPVHEAIWHGVFHSVAAFCNAGFDLQGGFQSMVPYQGSLVVSGTLMVLIQAGALSWVFFADLGSKRRWRTLAMDTKLVCIVHGVLLVFGAGLFLTAEWNATLQDVPLVQRPMVAAFQSVAARSAGINTVNFAEVTSIVLFAWLGIMFIGGASGSTAGGLKLATVGVIGLAVAATLRGQPQPQFFGKSVPSILVYRAMAVVTLMFVAHFVSTLALVTTEHFYGRDHSFLAMLFETMSAISTTGLSNGITADLSSPGKVILVATMVFGLVGPLTVAYALQARQRIVRHRFPEEQIRIG